MAARILVGTASWSDPGFIADWYPPGLAKNRLLGWYAEHFNFVEVNSTFYSVPTARVVEGWVRQTPSDFVFDVKLFKLLSRHSVEAKFLPPDLRKRAKLNGTKVVLTPELEDVVAERILSELEPLREAGKLGGVLLQLSPAFRPKTNELEELKLLIEKFSGVQLAVELRNRDWMTGEQKRDTLSFFGERRTTLVTVDAPESAHFTVMPFTDEITNPELAYWRFHGRNEKAFVTGRTVADRFDYDYSEEEIEDIAEAVQETSKKAKALHLVFNNNRSHYAPKAAAKLLQVLEAKRLA
jgi:uncharacterized protein YecE (DUF72 family)